MSFFDGNLTIEVATASGIEAVTKRELLALGYCPSGATLGRMTFEGKYVDAVRANMFLRTANRVRIVIAKFACETFDELFDGIRSVCWQDIISKNGKVIVNAKSQKSKLFALRSVQSLTKKAIASKLCEMHSLSSLPESGETYDIEVSIACDIATVTLDTSGESLHKRGYRTYLGDAPLRETLASAMLQLSVWKPDRPLIDPFCGSGTIPVEGALIGMNVASGLKRSFACEGFSLAPSIVEDVREEARQLVRYDAKLEIFASDINESAIALAKKHAYRAGVDGKINFSVCDMKDANFNLPRAVIVTNPPYGERLMSDKEVATLYRAFGDKCKDAKDLCTYAITSFVGFEKQFGKKADKVRKLYNSQIECNFYQYLAPKINK